MCNSDSNRSDSQLGDPQLTPTVIHTSNWGLRNGNWPKLFQHFNNAIHVPSPRRDGQRQTAALEQQLSTLLVTV